MTAIRWPKRVPRLRARGRWAVARPDLLSLEARLAPATFTVTSFSDGVAAHPGDGTAHTSDGRITLRSAVMELNAEGGGTVILPALLSAGTGPYTLSAPGTAGNSSSTGDVEILSPITIEGSGSTATTIKGDGADRIFHVGTSQNVTLQGLTLTGGEANAGGAVLSDAGSNLELADVHLTNNSATGNGGAIAVIANGTQGQLTLHGVFLQNNTAGGLGGAVYMDGLTVVISPGTIAGNSAAQGGGAIAIVDNQHIGLAGAQIATSTITGNTTAGAGGAILLQAGIVNVTDTTVDANKAADGGGFKIGGGTFRLANTIVAGDTAPTGPDISGSFTSNNFNLIGSSAGVVGTTFASSDIVGTASNPIDPLLSPLVLHGGNLEVQVPEPGSPALGAGKAVSFLDERGGSRPGSGDDIGAIQAGTFAISTTSDGEHAIIGTKYTTDLNAEVTENGFPLPGAVVTFIPPDGGAGGTFASTATVRTDATGTATAPTFTANSVVGPFTVTAAASPAVSTTISLTNDAAPPDTLTVSVTPGSVEAGFSFQITVTAKKFDGTVDTGYLGTVSFSTDSAALATFPSPTAFTSADAGTKTFQATMAGAGTHTITVTDASGPTGQTTVTITPAINRFLVTGPSSVNEGQPFSITITAQDPHGNPLPGFVGAVTLSSNDGRAVLPTGIVFTAADNGVKTISGITLLSPGARTVTATATDGTTGSASVTVIDLGPSGLTLSTDNPSIPEGSAVNLSGSFTNPDPTDSHTVSINWGDGTAATVLNLGAGVFNFTTAHTYGDETPAGLDGYPINVTVTDAAAGTSTTGSTSVSVTTVPPTLPKNVAGILAHTGESLGQQITFTDPGADTWTATADYGDGTGTLPVPISGHTLTLDHAYKSEGTFTIHLTLKDDDGGADTLTETAAVFLPGATNVQVATIQPGDTQTITFPGAMVTLQNLGGTGPATLIGADIDPRSLSVFAGTPTASPNTVVTAYDIRILNAGPDSVLTAKLTFGNGAAGSNPTLLYFDQTAGRFVAVTANPKATNAVVVDAANHTLTFILGGVSKPGVTQLGGTVFTLSVPTPPSTTGNNGGGQTTTVSAGTSPFFLASALVPNSTLAAADAPSATTPIPTTGLVNANTLTVAVSAAEGLARGGGDEPLANRLVNPQTLSTVLEAAAEISDYLKEAFQMWLDQPAPMQAPPMVQPPPDLSDQVQLRQTPPEVAADAKLVETNPPPAVLDALAAPPPKDAVVAPAEERPWWLAAAPQRPEDAPIAIPAEHEPTAGERAGAAVTAVWIGGTALAAVIPEVPADEDDDEQRPPPESETDNAD